MTRKLFIAVLMAATSPAFAQNFVVHAGHMVDVDRGEVLTDRAQCRIRAA